jgi:hypothetical protein
MCNGIDEINECDSRYSRGAHIVCEIFFPDCRLKNFGNEIDGGGRSEKHCEPTENGMFCSDELEIKAEKRG